MKSLFPILVLTLISSGFLACDKDDESSPLPPSSTSEALVFGHYYGMCAGEQCVEIFKLDNNLLKEDTLDQYPAIHSGFYSGNYIVLSTAKFNLASDLISYFPDTLLTVNDTTFGCPDCADQGGLYIEYKSNSVHKYWLIDQARSNVPSFLHSFIDKVNEKISLIR